MAKYNEGRWRSKRCESKIVVKRRHAIMDKATLLEKGIKILDPERFMWT
jgi:DNA-directed RNA polymerase subunit RPC12/RpoP